ncbi:hypothetical protein SH1V18_10740 [Vallitalea longa]|uniref:Aminotransferase class V domain-containing protein n=1 Tax=Vallitalea longa TaxID=2936439 RepID=A0A9W6DFD7_9FIRM|nr:alanine--glyoxylate aminotransferase family protein [Vallitalea longa]GKX28594.1 hypothetical protein SH1V18_10740 [Vallitalea longa]
MKNKLLMTPGPTYVSEEVRMAMSKPITNPDFDIDFYDYYRETCNKIKKMLHTENDVLILAGEGILGLEAACASLIEQDDKVLCIDNGIFGKGFGDFAKLYGGDVTFFSSDYTREIDVEKLESFLQENHDYKVATLVHCETPSGITNPIDKICPILDKYGIISIVDAVSSMGGEPLEVDKWKIDIVLGGSQKCISAPPGLTLLGISDRAWNKIMNRNKPVPSFYCNLSLWKNWYEDKWFPYTQSISDIYGLNEAVDRMLRDDSIVDRHRRLARGVRTALLEAGLELYPDSGFSNTVTTIMVPSSVDCKTILDDMANDYNIIISGAFDYLKDKVIRIGHMGENCYEEKLYITLKAIDSVLRKRNVTLKCKLHNKFVEVV